MQQTYYNKLVNTFHIASECNTDVYFKRWNTGQFKHFHSWTDKDLYLATETEQDRMRLPLLQKIPHLNTFVPYLAKHKPET